jgi:hypothetical protein
MKISVKLLKKDRYSRDMEYLGLTSKRGKITLCGLWRDLEEELKSKYKNYN